MGPDPHRVIPKRYAHWGTSASASCVKPTWRPRRNHPQIVAVYNRGDTDDGQLWIAMQFVDVWLTATGSAMATRA
jgi:hypothetical protein